MPWGYLAPVLRGPLHGRALRFTAPRRVEIEDVDVPSPASGEVLIRTRYSGISGGTELLAYRGEVDPDEPLDETIGALGGTFRYPFAYGYSCVGTVERSSAEGIADGDVCFAFHPHQDLFTAAASDVVKVDGIDPRTATLFPLVETALQAALDAGPRMGDVVVVQGLGPVGALIAFLLQRAGADVIGVEPRADRREIVTAFGIRSVDRDDVRSAVEEATDGAGATLLVDATGAPSALGPALSLLGHEGEALVCSWYGTKEVPLPLGGAFHRRRLSIRSTQVSSIPSRLAARWSVPRRRRTAVALLHELPLKVLATHEVPFARAGEAYAALDRGEDGPMHVALSY
jgi:2-desacetyl-2-hydroxyethyl bacteriochlorophyllide A dehydrogenase